MRERESDQSLHYKQASREFLLEIAVMIAKRLEENVREKLRGDAEIAVHVNVTEDWPYTFEVTLEAKSKIMDKHKLKAIVEEALDEELEKIAGHMEKRGFKLLP